MTKLLSEDAVAAYQRDGYYFPVDILSEAETRTCATSSRRTSAPAAGRSRATGGTSRISISPS